LATALQRQGFAPELIEGGAAWPSLGAEINLPANGPRLLRRLGLGAAIWERPGRRWAHDIQ
jgi:2-polyprenyl-6-methoxyphenol hydroxylase-like FAD-dependent oxidoreductase